MKTIKEEWEEIKSRLQELAESYKEQAEGAIQSDLKEFYLGEQNQILDLIRKVDGVHGC
jgi:DNA-binding ferritin-like protein (Dps family)